MCAAIVFNPFSLWFLWWPVRFNMLQGNEGLQVVSSVPSRNVSETYVQDTTTIEVKKPDVDE